MANFATLKAAIVAAIRQNGNNEITGQLLQQALLSMIDSLGGAALQFKGVATLSTNPGTPDQRVFYFAPYRGVYSNFSNIEVGEDEFAFLAYTDQWYKFSVDLKETTIGKYMYFFNPSKNAIVNRVIFDIHIDGTKQDGLKYFVRSCRRNDSLDGFYFAIQSYDPQTGTRSTIVEFFQRQSGVYKFTNAGYTTTIGIVLENMPDNSGFTGVDYDEQFEIKDSCWNNIHPLLSASFFDSLPVKDSDNLLKSGTIYSAFKNPAMGMLPLRFYDLTEYTPVKTDFITDVMLIPIAERATPAVVFAQYNSKWNIYIYRSTTGNVADEYWGDIDYWTYFVVDDGDISQIIQQFGKDMRQLKYDDSFGEFINYELIENRYWGENGLTVAMGFYATKQLIPVVDGLTIYLEQFINPETALTSAAGFLYDKDFNAVGSRINISDLTVVSSVDNILSYTVPIGTNARYIGFSTAKTNPQKIRLMYPFAITETSKRIAKNKYNVVDLMVFMGQSNMAGRGITTPTYPEKAPYVPLKCGQEFRPVTDPTQLYQIEEPFGVNENNAGINDGDMKTGGLVSAFVNSYYNTCGVPVIGVSASKGGTNIEEWQMDGTLLPEAIARFNAAVSFLESKNYKIRHKYMVWLQGENDSSRVNTYRSLFRNVVDAMENAGVECCLLIRIGRNSSNTSQDGIINLQTLICKESNDVILISTGLAQYAEKGQMKDTQHFFQFSYNECGKQAGHNAAIYSIAKAERMQYDCMTQEMYFSEKCL